MLCSETGGQQAIRLHNVDLALVRDIDMTIGAITAYGHGEGTITMKVNKGRVPILDWMVRKFREKKVTSA